MEKDQGQSRLSFMDMEKGFQKELTRNGIAISTFLYSTFATSAEYHFGDPKKAAVTLIVGITLYTALARAIYLESHEAKQPGGEIHE